MSNFRAFTYAIAIFFGVILGQLRTIIGHMTSKVAYGYDLTTCKKAGSQK